MVRKYSYREAPTPQGLKGMEHGTLKHFDIEMFSNLNTGVLEQYLEEKNRVEGFIGKPFLWKRVIVGLVIGTIFAVITEYVGLKVGIAISGGWYIVYIIGLALRWGAREVNIAAGASTGATYIATGFIFTFPALYLLSELSKHEQYALAGGRYLITQAEVQGALVPALLATIIAGFIGVLYFIIFRRIWLIEDPLHVPGVEANIKLLDMSHSISKGAMEEAKKALKLVCSAMGITMLFTFFRDFPVTKMEQSYAYYGAYGAAEASTFDWLFKGSAAYDKGTVLIPYEYDKALYTHIDFGLIPIQLGIGWFMKFRVALLVSLGTLLQWFIIVPLALLLATPVYATVGGATGFWSPHIFFFPSAACTPALVTFSKIGRLIAIGAILGGGITGLLKMAPAFKSAAADVIKTKGVERRDFIIGRGWYEWPVTHIKAMLVLTLILVLLVFLLSGFGLGPSLLVPVLLVLTTFFFGAIAVKVMGETGSEPVSGTSFLVLLLLIGGLLALRTPPSTTAVIAIIGTTVFAGAISMSGDIIWDFKSGLYCGNRPYHLMKGELIGIVPGAIAGMVGAIILSEGLATKQLPLIAPQAHAFATTIQVILSGETGIQTIQLLILGGAIGIFAELMTGMGTAFGLGMYFPLSLTLPMLLGGGLRDLWEKKSLEPRAKAEKWDERTRTLKVIDTYMIATGLIVGEAIMGTIVAIYIMMIL
ncbi:MAG: OPT/YSL family transporter [Candidatus Thermoplasmatota archaeon]|nr:OPT/YSL family transporter [Candidatus Thermoplasmatota archaeon]